MSDSFSTLLAMQGLLPSRGSFMLDFVFLAMFAVIPVLGYGIHLARHRKKYQLHKRLQLATALILLTAVLAFEVDMRFFTDWRALAEPSPYYTPGQWGPVWYSLIIHLACAIPTLALWIGVIVAALRCFPSPPVPGSHSRRHVFWARWASLGMLATAVTGWVFYWLAFVAS